MAELEPPDSPAQTAPEPASSAALDQEGPWRRRLPFRPLVYAAGILVALLLPRLLPMALRAGGVTVSGPTILLATVPGWLTVAVLVAMVVRLEKAPLRSLFPGGLRLWHLGVALAFAATLRLGIGPAPLIALAFFWPRRPTERGRERLLWLAGLVVVSVAGTVGFHLLADVLDLGRARPGSASRNFVSELSILERLALVVTTSVTEEIRYRTYLMERLHGLRLAPGLAALASYVVFVAAHIPFMGLDHVLRVTAIGSVGFPVLYYLTRSFWACSFLHFALNIFILAA